MLMAARPAMLLLAVELTLFSASSSAGLCSDPGQPNNGIRMDHNFSFGQIVRFRCNPYFLRKGPRAIKCQDGRWDGSVPQCSECSASLQPTIEDQSYPGTITLQEPTLITELMLMMNSNAGACKLYLKLQIHKEQNRWKTFYGEGGQDEYFTLPRSRTYWEHLKFKEPFIAQRLRLKCHEGKKPDLESVKLVGCKDSKGFFDCILVGSKVWVQEGSSNTDKRTVYKQEHVHKIQEKTAQIRQGKHYIKHIVPDIIASKIMLTPGTRVIAKDGGTFYGGTVKRELGNSQWEIESQGVFWTSDLNNIRIIEQPKYCAELIHSKENSLKWPKYIINKYYPASSF